MKFESGSLVNCRDREWQVLQSFADSSMLLKPLGGVEAETVRIFPELEKVVPAEFSLPNPAEAGDARSCAILRDAVRLGLRATTGPFRSFGHIAVQPRPYQLVPLLMALKQPVIRLLIADDVGIGKTVEALLIAREMLDRGEIQRLAIICPPQLAEQWQKEMSEKFHLVAELVLPSTVNRLERGLGPGVSLFDKYPFTIVSLDFIKSDRFRHEFIRSCPEFVIIDEAHTCASAAGGRGHKQRYELVSALASNSQRHMLFVTATPHSGKEDVFRSLLAFLQPDFATLPEDLAGKANEKARKELAAWFVQRRRGDILAYMDQDTKFPLRRATERTWQADEDWKKLFDEALNLARNNIKNEQESSLWRQRISWWSALALLRAVSSSPAAALQSIRSRALGTDETVQNIEELDSLGRQATLDLDSGDESPIIDILPGANPEPESARAEPTPRQAPWRKLEALAESLWGAKDSKLQALIPELKELLEKDYSPVIFCRFIPTAEYLGEELRKALPNCSIEVVTGNLPPEEREARVLKLTGCAKRLLVCTDCLSEGINLQTGFNAVIHYDLSWNPTRHEQREGRVDRFGQPSPEVRIITWWGKDNPMDGLVLDVLLRKHESIRKALGISVPVPVSSQQIIESLLDKLLRKRKTESKSLLLPGLEKPAEQEKINLATEWENVAQAEEKRSRSLFAQQSVKIDAVAEALNESGNACGDNEAVEKFMLNAMKLLGAVPETTDKNGRQILSWHFDALAQKRYPGLDLPLYSQKFVFELPAASGQTYLSRTHPIVEQLAAWLAQNALDPVNDSILCRCGAMRTRAVGKRTTLLLCRFRFRITTTGGLENCSLAEECAILAFAGSPQKAVWLEDQQAQALLEAEPAGNIDQEQASDWIGKVEEGLPLLLPHIEAFHKQRAEQLLYWQRRVRATGGKRNLRYNVDVQGRPDIPGIFIFLPCPE